MGLWSIPSRWGSQKDNEKALLVRFFRKLMDEFEMEISAVALVQVL